jgi:GxxExxY protein
MLVKDPLVQKVIGCAIAVHRELGPGLLESTYKRCLCWELSANEIAHKSEVAVPLRYRGVSLDCGYRIDLLIEEWLVVEIKSVASILPIHIAQALTYVRLFNSRQGLIINFNAPRLKDGLRSVIPKGRTADESWVAASQGTSEEAHDVTSSTLTQKK